MIEQGKHAEIAEFLKEKRKSRGLTQGELAEQLKISQSRISKFESGLFIHKIIFVLNYFKILKIRPHEIFKLLDKINHSQGEG